MKIYKVALQGCGFINWLNVNQPMTFNEDLVLTQIFETLFNKNQYDRIENSLVQNYFVENNKLILVLKQRKFHDGTLLTAQDVIKSLVNTIQSPYKHNNNSWTGHFIQLQPEEIKKINKTKLSIQLNNNSVNEVLEELCKVKYSIMKNGNSKIGTGPYFVDQVKSQDQKVILNKSKYHPKKESCVDQLHMIGYKNNFDTLKAFLNKQVDQVRVWGLRSPFMYNPNTLLVPSKSFYSSYFQFNTNTKHFSKTSTRRHFRDCFLQNIMLHKDYPWKAFTGIIPNKKFNKPMALYKKDKIKTVTLGVAHKRQKKEVERLIDKELFKSYGYIINIHNYDSYEKLYSSQADLIYTAFSYELNNKNKLPQIFHSNHRKNKTHYKDQVLDDLITKDTKQAEKYIWSQALAIPLGSFQCSILTHKDSKIFCGIKNNKVTPVLYESKIQDFIQLFSSSQKELFKLREKNWSHLNQKAKVDEIINQFQHDIKSPLSVLSLMLKSFSNSQDGYQRVLHRIEEFNDDIKSEINKAFKETKSSSEQRVNLHDIINELCSEKTFELNNTSNIKLYFEYDKKIEFNYKTCPLKIKRVVSNIINNAIESRDKWNHSITVSLEANSQQTSIKIKDNGRGFTDDHLKTVLSRAKITNKKQGQGLGLYSSKQFVESIGGELIVKSKSKLYTEVIILLKDQSLNTIQSA